MGGSMIKKGNKAKKSNNYLDYTLIPTKISTFKITLNNIKMTKKELNYINSRFPYAVSNETKVKILNRFYNKSSNKVDITPYLKHYTEYAFNPPVSNNYEFCANNDKFNVNVLIKSKKFTFYRLSNIDNCILNNNIDAIPPNMVYIADGLLVLKEYLPIIRKYARGNLINIRRKTKLPRIKSNI